MNTLPVVIVIVYVFIISLTMCLDNATSGGATGKGRVKRYLSFPNNSHFFVRLNFKANMVPWNQIFAQAIGYRLNIDLPPDNFHHYPRLHRRDVYRNMEVLFDRNGLDGLNCLRRAICEVQSLPSTTGLYHRILKIIFRRRTSATDKWHRMTATECDISLASCPLSLMDVSLFTDL